MKRNSCPTIKNRFKIVSINYSYYPIIRSVAFAKLLPKLYSKNYEEDESCSSEKKLCQNPESNYLQLSSFYSILLTKEFCTKILFKINQTSSLIVNFYSQTSIGRVGKKTWKRHSWIELISGSSFSHQISIICVQPWSVCESLKKHTLHTAKWCDSEMLQLNTWMTARWIDSKRAEEETPPKSVTVWLVISYPPTNGFRWISTTTGLTFFMVQCNLIQFICPFSLIRDLCDSSQSQWKALKILNYMLQNSLPRRYGCEKVIRKRISAPIKIALNDFVSSSDLLLLLFD